MRLRRHEFQGLAEPVGEDKQAIAAGLMAHLRGFGRARPGGEAPSPQTPFVLESTTQSFTTLAMMQLVEVGKIKLDAPVQR